MWKIKYKIDRFLRNIIKEEINNYNLENTYLYYNFDGKTVTIIYIYR